MNNKKGTKRQARKGNETPRKKRIKRFNKVGIEIIGERPPRNRFINGDKA